MDSRTFQNNSDFSMPAVGVDGRWGTLGGIAIGESLSQGAFQGVLDVFSALDASGFAEALRQAGFNVSPASVVRGADAVLAEVRKELEGALGQADGVALSNGRMDNTTDPFAAKGTSIPLKLMAESRTATTAVQDVFNASRVSVDLVGATIATERDSMLLVAAQAMVKEVQGFNFEGIDGKFSTTLSMAELSDLHKEAASAVAEHSVKSALGVWMTGAKVSELHDWVPDSVQRLLMGSLALAPASVIVQALSSGAIAKHAAEIGEHKFTQMLADQGYDINALTVAQQAQDLGLSLKAPDQTRGQYFGVVVGLDHRAGLVKYNRTSAVELPFSSIGKGLAPEIGQSYRLSFNNGELTVSVALRSGREANGI